MIFVDNMFSWDDSHFEDGVLYVWTISVQKFSVEVYMY